MPTKLTKVVVLDTFEDYMHLVAPFDFDVPNPFHALCSIIWTVAPLTLYKH
jgi:hypothetical protein